MKNIAMFLVMVLTFTQIPTVPTAAEDFTENMFQEVELFQDSSDAVPEPEKEPDVDSIQEPELFQDGAEAVSVELFSAGDTGASMPVLTSGEEKKEYHLNYDYIDTIGNGTMLPKSTMTISTHLMDCTDNDNWLEVTGYTLEILSLGEAYNNEFQASVNGTDLLMRPVGLKLR